MATQVIATYPQGDIDHKDEDEGHKIQIFLKYKDGVFTEHTIILWRKDAGSLQDVFPEDGDQANLELLRNWLWRKKVNSEFVDRILEAYRSFLKISGVKSADGDNSHDYVDDPDLPGRQPREENPDFIRVPY